MVYLLIGSHQEAIYRGEELFHGVTYFPYAPSCAYIFHPKTTTQVFDRGSLAYYINSAWKVNEFLYTSTRVVFLSVAMLVFWGCKFTSDTMDHVYHFGFKEYPPLSAKGFGSDLELRVSETLRFGVCQLTSDFKEVKSCEVESLILKDGGKENLKSGKPSPNPWDERYIYLHGWLIIYGKCR